MYCRSSCRVQVEHFYQSSSDVHCSNLTGFAHLTGLVCVFPLYHIWGSKVNLLPVFRWHTVIIAPVHICIPKLIPGLNCVISWKNIYSLIKKIFWGVEAQYYLWGLWDPEFEMGSFLLVAFSPCSGNFPNDDFEPALFVAESNSLSRGLSLSAHVWVFMGVLALVWGVGFSYFIFRKSSNLFLIRSVPPRICLSSEWVI